MSGSERSWLAPRGTHTLLFLPTPALGHLPPSDKRENLFCNGGASKFPARLTAGDINRLLYELKT